MTSRPTDSELPRIHGFLSDFHRRQANRVVDFPGGFAALDDRYTHSRGNNHLLVDGPARLATVEGGQGRTDTPQPGVGRGGSHGPTLGVRDCGPHPKKP